MRSRKPTHPGEVLLEDVIKPSGDNHNSSGKEIWGSPKGAVRAGKRQMRLEPGTGGEDRKGYQHVPGELACYANET